MSLNAKLEYVAPNGKSVTFYTTRTGPSGLEHPPYVASYITGVGGPNVEYENIPLTGGDGSYLGDVRYAARIIQTSVQVYGASASERDENLKILLGVLNPRNGNGTLLYTNHEGTYTITGRAKVLPTFGANSLIGQWKPTLVDFECPYPFFQGSKAFSTLVAASSGVFRLPFKLPFRLGSQVYKAEANNTSGVAVPLKIVVFGTAVNPSIMNTTTGQTIKVRRSIESGAKLTIVTGPEISVKITNASGVESDAVNYVDVLSSDWVQLAPGVNELRYSSDEDSSGTRIEVRWNDWYLGVG